MALFRQLFLAFLCYLIVIIYVEDAQGFPKQKSSSKSLQNKSNSRPILASVGATCKLKCPIQSDSIVKWYINGNLLNHTQDISKFTFRRRRSKEILEISKVTKNDHGTYSCHATGKRKVSWRIIVKKGKKGRCQRSIREKPVDECPKAPRFEVSVCDKLNFDKCTSFAGDPENISLVQFIYKAKRIPIIQLLWDEPKTGNRDLWGYEVGLFGRVEDTGNHECLQINRKDMTHYTFAKDIRYGALYIIKLRSLPSTKYHQKIIQIKEKCQFDEFKYEPICCSIVNLNATLAAEEGNIYLTWSIQCPDNKATLNRFLIHWHNLPVESQCLNDMSITQDPSTEIFNSTIHLEEECRKNNYTIKLYGEDNNKTKTEKGAEIRIAFPEKKLIVPSASHHEKPESINMKIVVAIVGVMFGLALVALFFIYKFYFSKVVFKLPVNRCEPPNTGANNGSLLEGNGSPKRVFMMHARCCEKCTWVVHCLGKLLNSTNAIEAICDIWNEPDIAVHPMRWYGEEVKGADCVIVLTSNKMKSNYDSVQENSNDNDDLLSIQAQLNYVSGEMAQDPNSPKFISAYFSYNGQRSDVPQFLNSRLHHKLTKDLDRLLFHVLNIEAIQPRRTQPIAILGGTPEFNSNKEDLFRAISEAKEHHMRQDPNNLLSTVET